ncbi:MAG: A/G-specific adenine glycosylase, partial [Clostridiales bacterium]|nr:A/G-specific adenine glycosylase [Clostridiales bacterium]
MKIWGRLSLVRRICMIPSLLLAWYDRCGRTLPFRGTKDPYRIWISEIMLQQTRTETVGDYYLRFLDRFPDVYALAEAEEQDVLKMWEGLGYYSRARNLHKAAKAVVNQYGGIFPADYEKLLSLPGVGEYTAAAVASIAFDLPCPAMDGNLTRVLSRLHGVRQDVGQPSVKRQLLALGREDMPEKRCGDFNQALMDLGATVCTPGTPECDVCPLRLLCNAYAAGDQDMLPVKTAAKPPKEVKAAVAILTCGAKTLLLQRKEALLNGLWIFPMTEEGDTQSAMERRLQQLGIKARLVSSLGEAKHIFTHRIWQMKLYHYRAETMESKEGVWASLADMQSLPLPTAVKAAKMQAEGLLTPQFLPLTPELMESAAAAYGVSWQHSHKKHCSEQFLKEHDATHMQMILMGHLSVGKRAYAIRAAEETAGILVLDPEENELVSLYIHPLFQRSGLGKAAVTFAVSALDAT